MIHSPNEKLISLGSAIFSEVESFPTEMHGLCVFHQLPKIVIFSSKGKLSNHSVLGLEYSAKFTQFEPKLASTDS